MSPHSCGALARSETYGLSGAAFRTLAGPIAVFTTPVAEAVLPQITEASAGDHGESSDNLTSAQHVAPKSIFGGGCGESLWHRSVKLPPMCRAMSPELNLHLEHLVKFGP